MDNKLRHQQKQQQEVAATHRQEQQAAREFAHAEEVVRFDAANVVVPPAVAKKLADSLTREPRPAEGWWKRWLGRSSL